MAQVDFYILSDASGLDPFRYGARLADKVYRLGMSLFVLLPDAAQVQAFSEQLWQLQDDGFLAHDTGPAATDARISVGDIIPENAGQQVLLNLAGAIPLHHERFARIAEIVPANPEAREQCRHNYRVYREKGYAVKTHNIGSSPR